MSLVAMSVTGTMTITESSCGVEYTDKFAYDVTIWADSAEISGWYNRWLADASVLKQKIEQSGIRGRSQGGEGLVKKLGGVVTRLVAEERRDASFVYRAALRPLTGDSPDRVFYDAGIRGQISDPLMDALVKRMLEQPSSTIANGALTDARAPSPA